MSFHRLDLVCRGIESFKGMDELTSNNFVVANLQGNHLSDFDGFGTHPYMAKCDLKGNDITTYYGLTRQRSLQSLDLRGNPITTHPFYRIMALMVVGFSLTEIDGAPVTPEERTLARRAGFDAALAISFGWLLDMKPRTPEAFKDIVSECKRLHGSKKATKKLAETGSQPKTVADALNEINAAGPSASPPNGDAARAARLLGVKAREREMGDRRTIERLSKRVATLEQMLREASAGCEAANAALILGGQGQEPLPLEYNGGRPAAGRGGLLAQNGSALTEHDLQDASSILFADGIATRSSQGSQNPSPRRSCLLLTRRAVTVLNYLTRSPTFELTLSGSVTVGFRRPKTLIVKNRFGVSLEAYFESFDVLRTVFKLLFLLRSKPVPPLPSYDGGDGDGDGYVEDEEEFDGRRNWEKPLPDSGSEEEEEEEKLKESEDAGEESPSQQPASSSAVGGWHPQTNVTQLSTPAAPPDATPKSAPLASEIDENRNAMEREGEDNIPDIPPLPPAGSSAFAASAAAPAPRKDDNGTGPDGASSASEISFHVEDVGSHNSGNDGVPVPEASPGGSASGPTPPPRVPPRASGRFQNLKLSSSDSDEDGAAEAVEEKAVAAPTGAPPIPPRRHLFPAPSLPPSLTRPPIPPRRASAAVSGETPVADPPAGVSDPASSVKALTTPAVPPRRTSSSVSQRSAHPEVPTPASGRAGSEAGSGGGAARSSAASRPSSVASPPTNIIAEAAAVAPGQFVQTATHSSARPTPVPSTRNSLPLAPASAKNLAGSVAASETKRTSKAPSVKSGATDVEPPPPAHRAALSSRFGNLRIDSDSDSDA